MRKLMPIIILVCAVAFGTWIGQQQKPKPKAPLGPAVRVDFIDVGQGDSIFIHTPDGVNALIDAGEKEYGDKVVSHLRRARVRRLDLVVMSHPHSDHIGGMPAVFEAFPVGTVLDSGYAHGTALQEKVLRIIETRKIPYRRARSGMEIPLGAHARLEVLLPDKTLLKGTASDANNNSIVVRLVCGQVRMLFPGDLEREGEGKLIASRRDLSSQVLKVPHHGSSDSTSLELLRMVGPQYVVISVGARNEYGHPHRRTLRRLAKDRTGAEMFRTDKNGTVTLLTDGRGIVVEKER